jgi:hypothetical protein
VDRKPSYQIEIDVLRFEANSAQEAQLFARWMISEGGDNSNAIAGAAAGKGKID